MCYCETPEAEILDDIKREAIPDDALVNECCWRRICQVRGWYPNDIGPETWSEICRKRGCLHSRENPRGF